MKIKHSSDRPGTKWHVVQFFAENFVKWIDLCWHKETWETDSPLWHEHWAAPPSCSCAPVTWAPSLIPADAPLYSDPSPLLQMRPCGGLIPPPLFRCAPVTWAARADRLLDTIQPAGQYLHSTPPSHKVSHLTLLQPTFPTFVFMQCNLWASLISFLGHSVASRIRN
jgi:hypothetical protein